MDTGAEVKDKMLLGMEFSHQEKAHLDFEHGTMIDLEHGTMTMEKEKRKRRRSSWRLDVPGRN